MVTHVSVTELASFAKVLPVHGAITRASNSFFGPIGSAEGIAEIIFDLQIPSILFLKYSAFPKRVSVENAAGLIMGVIAYISASFSSSDITLSKVQKDPVKAKPNFNFAHIRVICVLLSGVYLQIPSDITHSFFDDFTCRDGRNLSGKSERPYHVDTEGFCHLEVNASGL